MHIEIKQTKFLFFFRDSILYPLLEFETMYQFKTQQMSKKHIFCESFLPLSLLHQNYIQQRPLNKEKKWNKYLIICKYLEYLKYYIFDRE